VDIPVLVKLKSYILKREGNKWLIWKDWLIIEVLLLG
jgi:hypothetical protein